jgi:hypothetical protein
VLLANGDVKPKLETMAKDKKIENVPLTVSDDGPGGPPAYSLNKDVNFTVVVYNKKKKVTESFAFDKLDAKSQDAAIAAFCKVLGIDPPKAADAPKTDAPKTDAPKTDDPPKKDPD